MAPAIPSKGKRRLNDWTLGVLALFLTVLFAYVPVLLGMGGPVSSFQPDFFFAVIVAPVSLACLLCGLLALLTSPRPTLLAMIGLLLLLVIVFAQLLWVVIAAVMGG